SLRVETLRDEADAAAVAAASAPGANARVQSQATAPRAICLVALLAKGLTIRGVVLRTRRQAQPGLRHLRVHPAKPPSRPCGT
ncbi:MAG: hypothetical protein ACREV9_09185, partial [Burkholderiales bacterium]